MIDDFWSGAKIVDDQLMLWCTRFAHWFQRLTSRTSFFLAKLGLGLCVWSLVGEVVNYWYPIFQEKTTIFGVVYRALLVLGFLYDSIQCNKVEENLYDGRVTLPAWVIYQRVSHGRVWRLFAVGGTILVMTVAFLDLVVLNHTWKVFWLERIREGYVPGLTIYMYFIQVDPLPPGMSKVREWVESFGFGPKLVKVED